MRDGNYSHIKNSYLLTYQFPLQLNLHTDGTMVYLLPVGILTMLTTLLLHVQSAWVGSVSATRCCQQADAEPLLACRPGWLIQYCIDLFVAKILYCFLHEYTWVYLWVYLCQLWKICGNLPHMKKLIFYWLISSCLDLVSVRVGSVSAICRSGLVPNRFWHVERAGWFNIVADLFVTLIWYCFLHEYTWVYLCQLGKIWSQEFVLTWKRFSFYWLIGS